jgi:hypothetical protein
MRWAKRVESFEKAVGPLKLTSLDDKGDTLSYLPIYLSSRDYAEIEKHLGRIVPGKQYDTTEIVRKSYKAFYGSFIDPTLLSPGVVTIAKVEENGPYSMRLMLKAEEASIRSIFALHHLHFIKTRVLTTYSDASYESEMGADLRQFSPLM